MIQYRYAIYLSYKSQINRHSFSLTDFNSVSQSEIIHVTGQYQYYHSTSHLANQLVNQQHQSVSSSASMSLQLGSISTVRQPVTHPTSQSIHSISQSVSLRLQSGSISTVRQPVTHPTSLSINSISHSASLSLQFSRINTVSHPVIQPTSQSISSINQSISLSLQLRSISVL